MTDAIESWQNTVRDIDVTRAVLYSFDHGGGTFAVPSLFPMHPTRGFAVGLGNAIRIGPNRLHETILTMARRITGRCCLGTWREPSTGLWFVEQARMTSALSDALELGRAFGQSAVYSFSEGKDVAVR